MEIPPFKAPTQSERERDRERKKFRAFLVSHYLKPKKVTRTQTNNNYKRK